MFSTYKKTTEKNVLFLLALAGVALLTACEKDEPMHDTTYLWGRNYWKEVYPTDKINASADSVQVRYVILRNNGANWGNAYTAEEIRDNLLPIINGIKQSNMHKIKWTGKLTWVKEGGDPTAKAWLENLGLQVEMADESRNK